MVIKALIILVWELITCYLFGTLIARLIMKKQTNLFTNTVIGFLAYQVLFQILSLGCYFTVGVLHYLTGTWVAVVVLLSVGSIVICRRKIVSDIRNVCIQIKGGKVVFAATTFVVMAFCYYAAINGELNEDSRYYIALVNTTVTTDTLYRYNPYNGFAGDAFFLRRALTTFEIHSAVLCQIFQIHPLVLTRIFRACQNVILTSMVVYLCGQRLFAKEKERVHVKSCALVVVALLLQLLFASNIYTSATFFLSRAYEGKAFVANVVVLFALYISIEFVTHRKKEYIFLLLLIWWGGIAVSSSALVLIPAVAVIMIIPSVFIRRYQR